MSQKAEENKNNNTVVSYNISAKNNYSDFLQWPKKMVFILLCFILPNI